MKKRQAIGIAVLAVTLIVIWNASLFLDWQKQNSTWSGGMQITGNTLAYTANTQEPELWQAIKRTTMNEGTDNGFDPQFDESVLALDGKQVELPGVGFLLSSGLGNNEQGEEEVTEFLLLPSDGGVAWCCGLSPIAKQEFSVLVDCSGAPFSPSNIDTKNPAFFVKVEGVLCLQKENTLNALYTLENARVEFIEIEDVLPPNVMNLCRNQQMTPQDLIRRPNVSQSQSQPIQRAP
jgi:hypothetical protein